LPPAIQWKNQSTFPRSESIGIESGIRYRKQGGRLKGRKVIYINIQVKMEACNWMEQGFDFTGVAQ
jgi:hypothetical protein